MGNAGGSQRERHKSTSETAPSSPVKDGQAFVFDKKEKMVMLHSQEEEEQYYSKPPDLSFETTRPRSNTETENQPNDTTPTLFRWEGGGKDVYISGTFSKWKAIPMVKSRDDFVTIINLPEGEHQYKFYVDGEWRSDPSHKTVQDPSGITNNMISVKKSDFEVFEALDKDQESCGLDAHKEFTQEIPMSKPWGESSGPPILPPHLLQVILNKDTPLSCEPTLLPEPNHVMLNHLYALSIKDGVMVLSATHRYRKKYVTTLLYKPI